MTYNGVHDMAQWQRFTAFVEARQKPWKVKYWCATLEATKAGALHVHLFLQFSRLPDRCSKSFAFEDLTPNAQSNDLLGEGWCKRKLQESLNRGFFYVWANKIGTQKDEHGNECTAGNYAPCWTDQKCTYEVRGRRCRKACPIRAGPRARASSPGAGARGPGPGPRARGQAQPG